MELTEEWKQQIDNMSYRDMLTRWRFAPVGDPMFQGETGDYFTKVMFEKKKTVNHVAISKEIGFER